MRSLLLLLFSVSAFQPFSVLGQSTGDVLLSVKSASGPLTPAWITKTASRALGWDSSGVLGPIPLGSGGTWGSITGTLSAQTDLQSALDSKLSTATASSTYAPIANPTFVGQAQGLSFRANPALGTGAGIYAHNGYSVWNGTAQVNYVTSIPGGAPSLADVLMPTSGTVISTTSTGAVTNTMLAGSIALSKLSIAGTPNGTKFLRDNGEWATVSTDLTTPSTGAFTTTTATSVVTADVPGLAITQEWNNGAVSFSALKISATNTASVSPATYPSAFLRIFVNDSEVGGFYNYYNSLSMRCNNVEMGVLMKNHGISRQSDSIWNLTAADTYVASVTSDQFRLSSLSQLTWKGDSAPYTGSPDTGLKRSAAGTIQATDGSTGYGIIQDLYRRVGSGSPEGAITAPVGCIYHRTDTGDLYRKTSGTGSTGWVTP